MKYIYTLIALVVFLLICPFILWQLQDRYDLEIAIINKTVSTGDVREHLGIHWFANHYKLSKKMDAKEDYYGTKYRDGELLETGLPTDYSGTDMIYLADSYGVYEDDLNDETERKGARSAKILGGLEMDEWQAISKRLADEEKALFVAEFNTFASPTEQPVKNAVTDYLHMNWNGWVGRYFDELDYKKNIEIPQWVVNQFEGDWPYKGEGFLLANDYTYEIVVLEFDAHVASEGIRLAFTEQGQELFGLKDSPNYEYWFDIITPDSEAQILAYYDWELTEVGRALLAEHGIPEQFAAVLKNDTRTAQSYYFAGDYNDIAKTPFFSNVYGLPAVNKLAYSFGESAFFWNTYIPMMEAIMKRFEAFEVKPVKAETLQQTARINDQTYEVLIDGEWQPMTIKGVNIGMGKPGAFPGEAAITYNEYYRWIKEISEMNANTIRVYTLHPPDFYQALADFNTQAEKPIYVIHGVWIGEEHLEETLDAYNEQSVTEFQQEMKIISDVIHGNAYIEHRPGHASGNYTADISKYVIGWILGIEWYPAMVLNTNTIYAGKSQYNGRFFETKDAEPFEIWMAERMDYLFAYELDTYNSIRPMAASNWPTTDLLVHPSEPSVQEDLVSFDPNKIYTKNEADLSGQFASYHVYPYYPDFQNNEPELLNFIDHRGEKNTYAGYLKRLHDAHRIPVLISEFGIPNSRGLTHNHVYGFDQGFKSEQEQGELVVKLYEDILEEGLLGGIVFIWQDEWFKRTWNTQGYDNPDRRPYWSNVQTNEQRFGLLAFETNKLLIDGKDDWTAEPIGDGISVDSDEAYLYVKVDTTKDVDSVKVVLDTVPNQGLTADGPFTFNNGLEFVVNVSRNEANSRLMTNPNYHFFNYEVGPFARNNFAETTIADPNVFEPTMYILNRRLTIPTTGASNPPEIYEAGKLKFGNGNPEAEEYNSLTDYHWTENMLEIRIPWLLLQAKDPSKREFIGDLAKDGLEASVNVEAIYIGELQLDVDGNVLQASMPMEDNHIPTLHRYTWEMWDLPKSKERLKKSYYILQKAFE